MQPHTDFNRFTDLTNTDEQPVEHHNDMTITINHTADKLIYTYQSTITRLYMTTTNANRLI